MPLLCLHEYAFPRRYDDGKDYQRCTKCGRLKASAVQFGRFAFTLQTRAPSIASERETEADPLPEGQEVPV